MRCAQQNGPHKTLYNLWKLRSETGVLDRILMELVADEPEIKTAMMDATYLKPVARTRAYV